MYYFSVVAPSHRSDDDVDFAKPLSTKVPQAKRASSASSASSSVGARKSLLPTNRSSSGKCHWVEGVLEFNLLKIMIPFLNLLHVYMIFVSSVYSKCNYFYIKLYSSVKNMILARNDNLYVNIYPRLLAIVSMCIVKTRDMF